MNNNNNTKTTTTTNQVKIVRISLPPPPVINDDENDDDDDDENDECNFDEDDDIFDDDVTTTTTTTSPRQSFELACALALNCWVGYLNKVASLPGGIYPVVMPTNFNNYMVCEVMHGPLLNRGVPREARQMHKTDYFQQYNIANPYATFVKYAEYRFMFKIVLVNDAEFEIHTF